MILRSAVSAALLGATIFMSTTSIQAQTSSPLAQEFMSLAESGHAHFNKRITEMIHEVDAIPADTTGTIVMVGDSITEGFFRKDVMPERIQGVLVVNQGISGDQIDRPTSNSGVTKRVGLIKAAKPAIVFVMIGVNDFWGGKEETDAVIPQYEKMFGMLKEAVPNAKIVLQSVLPTSKNNAYLNEKVTALNERIKDLAAENGTVYLDLHPVMEDEKGELKGEYTGDGVHLTEAAYAAWLKKLEETVAEQLKY